jgi:thiosulfate/3-mercaptopyruvate sulfurtransferase
MKKNLISTTWLFENINHPDLIVLDASPKSNASNLKVEFKGLQIKNARKFDIKNVFSNPDGDLPNTLPSAKHFETECQKLGINTTSKIVVYDNLGIYTSPRVWWLFKIMGFDVFVLNGGLSAWINDGYETEKIIIRTYGLGNFKAIFNPKLVTKVNAMLTHLDDTDILIVDARSNERFKALIPESRENLRSGHIPNSINLPYNMLLEDEKFKSKNELEAIFKKLQIDNKKLVFTCGSGITACIIMLASELICEIKNLFMMGLGANGENYHIYQFLNNNRH